MSFRLKIALVNIVLMSICFGFFGYLLIHRSFQNSLDTQTKRLLGENQIIKSNLEIEMLSGNEYKFFGDEVRNEEETASVMTRGRNISESLQGMDTNFALIKNHSLFYIVGNRQDAQRYDETMLEFMDVDQKHYVLQRIDGRYILYAASLMKSDGQSIYILTWRDISDVFYENQKQMRYFAIIMVGTLLFCLVQMIIAAGWLTKPISRLNETATVISNGDYSVRTNIASEDEIGELAGKFDLMADAVQQHVEELKEESRRREDFVANFTHEIKTPLTSMIGYSDMLRSRKMSEENQLMAANYIFTEGKRLERMSMKLFDMILIGRTTLEKQKISMEDYIEEIYISLEPMLEKKKITLERNIEPGSICGDRELLKTVFINLVDNAKKASKEQSSIVITGLAMETGYQITIQDFGRGMPKEEITKVTEAFYMVNKSRSREEGGAGLGLSLAVEIMKLHKGTLTIESELEVGTTIRLQFPLWKEEVNRDETE